jgi:hypothetical protein
VCVILFNDFFLCRFHDIGYIGLVGWIFIVLKGYFCYSGIVLKRLYIQVYSKFEVLIKNFVLQKFSYLGAH